MWKCFSKLAFLRFYQRAKFKINFAVFTLNPFIPAFLGLKNSGVWASVLLYGELPCNLVVLNYLFKYHAVAQFLYFLLKYPAIAWIAQFWHGFYTFCSTTPRQHGFYKIPQRSHVFLQFLAQILSDSMDIIVLARFSQFLLNYLAIAWFLQFQLKYPAIARFHSFWLNTPRQHGFYTFSSNTPRQYGQHGFCSNTPRLHGFYSFFCSNTPRQHVFIALARFLQFLLNCPAIAWFLYFQLKYPAIAWFSISFCFNTNHAFAFNTMLFIHFAQICSIRKCNCMEREYYILNNAIFSTFN